MNYLITLTLAIILAITIPTRQASLKFCSTYCSANACTSPWPTDCTTCQSPFTLNSSSCVISGQNSVFASELLMYNSFIPSGYLSNTSLSVIKCTGLYDYYMLGSLASNYIEKTFTSMGLNHYQLTVFYGYAVMTTTVWTRPILLQLIDGNGTVTNDIQTPNCALDGLQGCLWNLGCYSNFAKTISHASNSLTLNFAPTGSLSTGQVWGIRDIIIVLALCDASCATCTTGLSTNCITCAAGLYFSGTRCISQCAYYTMIDSKQCVISCPAYYYLNTANSFCQACPSGCSTCTSYNQCISWDQTANPANLGIQLMAVWIIVILLALFIVGLLVWKYCLATKNYYDSMQEQVIDHKPVDANKQKKNTQINQSHEIIDANWIQDIDNLHMTKVRTKKGKDTIQGIGNSYQ